MARTSKKGMSFSQGIHSRNNNSGWIMQSLTALAMFIAIIVPVSWTAGINQTNILLPMAIAGVYACLMYALLIKVDKQNWHYPITLMLILIVVLIGQKYFIEGMSTVYNQAMNSWTAGTGVASADLKTGLQTTNKSMGILLFSAVAGMFAALMCCFVTTYIPLLAAIMPMALLLLQTVLFNVEVHFAMWIIAVAQAVLMMLYIGKKAKSAAAALTGWVTCIISTAIITAIITVSGADDGIYGLSIKTKDNIHEKVYETAYTTLPEGDFENYTDSSGTAQSALVVSMSVPEPMYLRGFAGAVFEDNTWSGLDTRLLAQNEQQLHWLNLNGLNPNTQFSTATENTDAQTNTVMVQNTGACSKYMYVPFSLSNGEYISPEDLNAESVKGDGKRTYTYSCIYGGADAVAATLTYLQKSNESDVLEYRKKESTYRNFVYENYLQIPADIENMLSEEWDFIAAKYNSADNLTKQQAQECALIFLSRYFTEEGTAENADLPLSVAKNTSYQYATTAALTLRYYGIPARYAEGYVITNEMTADVEADASIKVDSSCAKAWVEVYQDGIGWIPMDMTPGMGELTEEQQFENPDSSKGKSENDDPDAKEGEEQEENPEDSENEPNRDGGFMARILKVVKKGISVLFVAFIISSILIYARRKYILNKKEKLFNSENINEASAWVYADIAALLESIGLGRGNGSMAALYDDLSYFYGKEYADDFMVATAINTRAMFSSKQLDDAQRDTLLEFRKKTLDVINSNVKWTKRQWIKWFHCLY